MEGKKAGRLNRSASKQRVYGGGAQGQQSVPRLSCASVWCRIAYHFWYNEYNHNRSDAHYRRTTSLGYATSPHGLHWTRHGDNAIFDESWTEDIMVLKHGDSPTTTAETGSRGAKEQRFPARRLASGPTVPMTMPSSLPGQCDDRP